MDSLKTYEKKYSQGYGLSYPDGHVVRFYERILNYKLGVRPGNILDFGCGNGTHLLYFKQKGWSIYGVDIVDALRGGVFEDKNNFCKIAPAASLKGLFSQKMDLIFANQSLYYLSKDDFSRTLAEFASMLNNDGLIFATMISTKNYYYDLALPPCTNGLQKVKLSGRLNEESNMFFIKDKSELQDAFSPYFKPLFLGEYDPINFYDFEGSAHHFIYVGQKCD